MKENCGHNLLAGWLRAPPAEVEDEELESFSKEWRAKTLIRCVRNLPMGQTR